MLNCQIFLTMYYNCYNIKKYNFKLKTDIRCYNSSIARMLDKYHRKQMRAGSKLRSVFIQNDRLISKLAQGLADRPGHCHNYTFEKGKTDKTKWSCNYTVTINFIVYWMDGYALQYTSCQHTWWANSMAFWVYLLSRSSLLIKHLQEKKSGGKFQQHNQCLIKLN